MLSKINKLYQKLIEQKVINDVADMSYFFFDEPKIFLYKSIENKEYKFYNRNAYRYGSAGISFLSRKEALLKCLIETIESLSCYEFIESELFFSPYIKIKKKALNPNMYTHDVLLNKKKINYQADDKLFGWTKGYNLLENKTGYIPAQLVYINYPEYALYVKNIEEPFLLHRDGNGCAAGYDLNKTLMQALYEVIERDAMTIMFFTKYIPPRIRLENIRDNIIKKLLNQFYNYNLRPYLFEITNDLQVPSFMAILVDPTGVGPFVTAGFCSRLDVHQAIVHALLEAFLVRSSHRVTAIVDEKRLGFYSLDKVTFDGMVFSGLFWTGPVIFKQYQYLLENFPEKTKNLKLNKQKFSSRNELDIILSLLENRGFEIWYKRFYSKLIKETNTIALRVIVPGLQPQFYIYSPTKIFINRLKQAKSYYNSVQR